AGPRALVLFSPMSDASPPKQYTIGLVQMSMSADPAANLAKAIAKVAEARAAGAALVCLPELFRSQYFAQREDAALFDLAEPVPGPSTEALGRAAHRAAGRQRAVLSHGDRLAPGREGRPREGAARRVAHHPAQPRDRERVLRGGGKPGRPRAPRRHRDGGTRVLGIVLHRRSV